MLSHWLDEDGPTVIGLDPESGTHRDLGAVKQATLVAGSTTKGNSAVIVLYKAPQ